MCPLATQSNGTIVLPGMPTGGHDLPPLVWEPYREGVAVSWVYRSGPAGPAAAFLCFQPGAALPPHAHDGYEHVHVLEGSQDGAGGRSEAGTLLVLPPGMSHGVSSEEGCLVFVVWEKLGAVA